MSDTLKIVWREVEPSAALAERIAEHVEALGAKAACRVTVARPHRHYHVTIQLGRIAITRDDSETADDAYAAVNSAFGRLRRRLAVRGPRRRAQARHDRRSH